MDGFWRAVFVLLVAGFPGWILFSLAAGVIVYVSTLTTNHASPEPKNTSRGEGDSPVRAHTRDPLIMEPLNAAKERWNANRDRHLFTVLSLRSADGLQLTAFYREASAPAAGKTVLIVHGISDSAAGMAYLAEEYHARGWSVLSIDQRSHGESGGTKRTMGVRESSDISLWVGLLVSRFRAPEIWLHGVSMGAAAVLLYGSRTKNVPPQVRGIIADSSYPSYEETFYRLLQLAVRSRFLAWSIVRGASFASLVLSGVPFSSMNPRKAIGTLSVPLLLFHGQKDVLIPIGQVGDMLDDAVQRVGGTVVVIPGAPHIGAYFYAPSLYMEKIEEFCRRNT